MSHHLSGVRAWHLAGARAPRPALLSLAVSCHLAGHPASPCRELDSGSRRCPWHRTVLRYLQGLAHRLGWGSLPGEGVPSAPRSLTRPSPCRWPAVCAPSNAISPPGGEARPLNTAPRGQARGHVWRAPSLLCGHGEALAPTLGAPASAFNYLYFNYLVPSLITPSPPLIKDQHFPTPSSSP